MTDREVIDLYKPLVPFIAELLGSESEVLLHDVSHPKRSVIAINNGFHSGRDIGSPLTDFAKQLIKNNEYDNKQYIANYAGCSKGKNFVSSTYFIKNNKKIIGMLCINRNMDLFTDFAKLLDNIKIKYNIEAHSDEVLEVLDETSVPQILDNMIKAELKEYECNPKRLTTQEKITIVNNLKNRGALRMKGSVPEIAKQLQISEPTVYRYMKR